MLVDRLAAQGIGLQHIDLGGGIGIVYNNETAPDLPAYAQAISGLLGQRKLDIGIRTQTGRQRRHTADQC